jgi:hypothetical protein
MNPVTGLSLGRIAVGVASIAAPKLVSSRVTGSAVGPGLLTQWFGNREIALGLATLTASGKARRNLVLIGIAVDAADAATAYLAVENEDVPRSVGLPGAGVAAGAVVAGLLGLRVKKRKQLETA